ncbi:8516_t:CDS:2, partial [Diversispora eburnea]
LDQEFPLNKGWALKENLKLGNKGGGKRISKKVVQYLQGYFLTGNLRAVDRYSPENMHTCLEELAAEGEIVLEEISTVKTIKGWIGRYSANFKKEASERALVENNKENINIEGNVEESAKFNNKATMKSSFPLSKNFETLKK